MRQTAASMIILTFVLAISLHSQQIISNDQNEISNGETINLPSPQFDGNISLEKALNTRRSARSFLSESLTLQQISQILWAAQGITKKKDTPSKYWLKKYEYQGGYRTAPSAGALFPIELYVVVGSVQNLSPAIYKYIPKNHSLKKVMDGNKTLDVYETALKQDAIKEAPVLLIISSVFERTEAKYEKRAERYVYIEVGAVCENVYLQCSTLGMGTVIIGAFNDDSLKVVLQLPKEENPMGIMPIGKPKN